ncbi:MAG: ribosome silencing factor [Chitinophagaceae bacterium]
MTPLSVSTTTKKPNVVKLTRSSKIFKTIIKAIQDKKGENIVSLDLRKIPEAVADFFLVCEASSNIQIKAIADFIEQQVKTVCSELPYKQEGYKGLQWVLLDYVNIVVHIMQPEVRKFYQLEEMWSDCVLREHPVSLK